MKRQRSFGEVVLVASVSFIFVLMMGAPWFAAIAYSFLFEDASSPRGPQGPAPIGSFELRREWGETNFKEHLAAAEKWIREDGNIKANILAKLLELPQLEGQTNIVRRFLTTIGN